MKHHHAVIKRLAFIKYLYHLAIQQSEGPEILACTSILSFHDSVELFLQLASEQLNAGNQQPGFMDYWKLLSPKIESGELPHKESMRRLNKARVSLKHNGTFPSRLDLESFRVTTTMFFEEATEQVFKTSFSEISLVDYVSPVESQEHLRKAQKFLSDCKLSEALGQIALSFDKMLSAYISTKTDPLNRSPYSFGGDLTYLNSSSMGLDFTDVPGLRDFVDNVSSVLKSMQSGLKVLSLGLDYKKYARFREHMPYVWKFMSGEYKVDDIPNESIVTNEYVQFCFDFVIESSIKLNEFDYKIAVR